MIFYRGRKASVNSMSRNAVKVYAFISILSYAAGCVWLLALPTEGFEVLEMVGWVLIVTSLLATGFVITSPWQRIAAEEAKMLDERELALQNRANAFSFRALAGGALLSIIYCALAADFELWIPTTYDHYNALFWWVFLLASVLPTAYLVWTQNDLEDGEP